MIIGIDPGHGCRDHGAVYSGIRESHLNLDISLKIDSHLPAEYEVVLTRLEDSCSSPKERRRATENCDFVICVHCNSNVDAHINGFEAYIWPHDPNNMRRRLAELVCENVADNVSRTKIYTAESYDWRHRARNVLSWHRPLAVLFECGYMSNASDLEKLTSDNYTDILAGKIAKGVNRWILETILI